MAKIISAKHHAMELLRQGHKMQDLLAGYGRILEVKEAKYVPCGIECKYVCSGDGLPFESVGRIECWSMGKIDG